LGGLYPLCEDCLSFAVVAAEFWSLQKKCGSQRTNRVRQTLGKGWRLLAGGAAVPTGGGGRRPQPRRCRHPLTTPATPSRIAPVVREENKRSQPPMKEMRSVGDQIRGASPQPSVVLIKVAGASSWGGRAPCGAPPSPAPAPLVRVHPSRPSSPKQAQARDAAGGAWQVQPATVSAPHTARVAPPRAVAHLRGWRVAWSHPSVGHTHNARQSLVGSALARVPLSEKYTCWK